MPTLILRLARLAPAGAEAEAAQAGTADVGVEPRVGAEQAAAAEPSAAGAPEPARHIVDLGDDDRPAVASTPLARWSAAVAAAHDPCLVVDPEGQVLSISTSAADLLGCSAAGVIGRRLLDVVDLVDFETGALEPDYAERIAPLAVLGNGGGLMRSLLRVRRPTGERRTIDASSAPLHDVHRNVIGSMSFLAPVGG
ncbi:MAG TPA: PAS domain-containing protein [Mycobacteriales bacterium]|nr:PAS domain-containing protein [Mycobacteriales bacterium]